MARKPDPPTTIKALYARITGDTASHQRRIDGHLKRMDPRRQRIMRRRAAGASLYEIAAEEGVSHGSVQSIVLRTCEAIRKAIAGEPRYTFGHPGNRGARQEDGRQPAA
jgi:DNA-directed RNA polymerase specialized sigma24 family protein